MQFSRHHGPMQTHVSPFYDNNTIQQRHIQRQSDHWVICMQPEWNEREHISLNVNITQQCQHYPTMSTLPNNVNITQQCQHYATMSTLPNNVNITRQCQHYPTMSTLPNNAFRSLYPDY